MVATKTAPCVIAISVSPPLLAELMSSMLDDLDDSVDTVIGVPAGVRPDLMVTSDPSGCPPGVPCILVPEPGFTPSERNGARVAAHLDLLLDIISGEIRRLGSRGEGGRLTDLAVMLHPAGSALRGRCVEVSDDEARVQVVGDVTIGVAVRLAFDEAGPASSRSGKVVGTTPIAAGETEIRVVFTEPPAGPTAG
jgi:hypothetical protein